MAVELKKPSLKRATPKKKTYLTPGRPRFSVSFEEARRLIREEGLVSKLHYYAWWGANMPARIPKRPDRAYKSDWKGWNDFLGNNNIFYDTPKPLRDFHAARDYARSLKLTNRAEWRALAAEKKLPDDIPSRPDYAYGLTYMGKRRKRGGYWYSWKDWLGSTSLTDQLESIRKQLNVLIITKNPQYPNGTYTFMVLNGFDEDIRHKIRKDQLHVLRAYIINDYDWGGNLDKVFQKFYSMNGVYIIPNIQNVYYNFDMKMDKYQ